MTMSASKLYSQDISPETPQKWTQFIHFESGIMYPNGSIKENIAIRQNISSYYVSQYSNGLISAASSGFYVGMRWEYFSVKYKSGISTGLRYTGYTSEISGYSSNSADFYYLRYSMEDTDTKFARIKSILETNSFISIPLEIRAVPFKYKKFELQAKVGAEISILNMNKSSDIDFSDNDMEIHQDLILNSIGTVTNKFYSTAYASIGLKYGIEDKPNFVFELFLPSVFLSTDNFVLSEVDYFDGFKLSLQFPINK